MASNIEVWSGSRVVIRLFDRSAALAAPPLAACYRGQLQLY
jgi:hypothetical protein